MDSLPEEETQVSETKLIEKKVDLESPLKMAFVGDICLAGGMQTMLREKGSDFPVAHIGSAFEDTDIVIGNLECCIVGSSRDRDVPSKNRMVVPEDLAGSLLKLGVNVVSLSNNHILDAGAHGIESTQDFLDRSGIKYFGAGRNRDEAEKPLFLESKGRKLAFIGACDDTRVYSTPSKAGSAALDKRRLKKRIDECKRQATIVIVVLHADLEFVAYPSPSRVRLSRWLIDRGADFVVQHHPHVCQGIEVYRKGLIAYSLGNFIFRVNGHEYLQNKSGTDWGVILKIEEDGDNITNRFAYALTPVTINRDNQTVPSAPDRRAEQLASLSALSSGLSKPRLLQRKRLMRSLDEAKSNLFRLYYTARRDGILSMWRAALDIVRSPYERRWIYSLLTIGIMG